VAADRGRRFSSASAGPSNLLPNHKPQRYLKRLVGPMDMLSQRIIDERLIVPTSRALHFAAKPVKDLAIKPNRDPFLRVLGTATNPLFPLLKSYSRFMSCPLAPCALALLPTARKPTAHGLPAANKPRQALAPTNLDPQRSSSSEKASRIVTARSSLEACHRVAKMNAMLRCIEAQDPTRSARSEYMHTRTYRSIGPA
jgi:hypothetical protein